MTKAPFSGPVVSQEGFAVGPPDDQVTVIDSDGFIHTTINIGTTASPVEVIGNVTGDVTGDITGTVTGNVTGNLTGNVIGNVTGDVTGNVTGDLTGDVTGDLIGNVGSTASPANFYGWAVGAFLGNAAFPIIANLAAIPGEEVPAGYFQLFYTSTGALVMATSTGVVGHITLST